MLHIPSWEVNEISARATDKNSVIVIDAQIGMDAEIFLTPERAIQLYDSLTAALKELHWWETEDRNSEVTKRLLEMGAPDVGVIE